MIRSLARSAQLAHFRPLLAGPATLRLAPARLLRRHATTDHPGGTPGPGAGSSAKRRAVTPFNDDGRVPWSQLSFPEKLGRTTQQSFNYALVAVGLVLTIGVGYLLYAEVFAPDSKIRQFNRAVDRVKQDPRCIALLGDAKKVVAHGEGLRNTPRRIMARPIPATVRTDNKGSEHLTMWFHVDGPRNNGIVHLYMVRSPGGSDFDYRYLFLEVPGHDRIYLENNEHGIMGKGKGMRFLGVKWT